MGKYINTLFALILVLQPAFGEVVCSVHDGDTFRVARVDCNVEKTRSIRLWGVDAPEIRQTLGIEARDYMIRLTSGRQVTLECLDKSYNRSVCKAKVSVTESQMLDLGSEMVGWGYAHDYAQYSKGLYSNAEAFARNQRRGVWTLPEGGVKPWDYRRSQRRGNNAAPAERSAQPDRE